MALLILAIFVIPLVFTKPFASQETGSVGENEEASSISSEEWNDGKTVRVWHTKSQTVEELQMDTYLLGVVSAEMPADFEIEALKAQAVVARTYTVYKIQHKEGKHPENAEICDDPNCCQAWISKEDRMNRWEEGQRQQNWNKIEEAVHSTHGKIITYEGKAINAFFHSNSGGKTEVPINVWGGSDYPYLQSVETAGEENYQQYASQVIMTKEELMQKMKEKYADFQIDHWGEDTICITEYTDSGRAKTVKIGNHLLSGVEARTLFGLKSAHFAIQVGENQVTFSVIGYGHGVGLSQTGSDSLAKQGENYEEIIHHFYQNVAIISM